MMVLVRTVVAPPGMLGWTPSNPGSHVATTEGSGIGEGIGLQSLTDKFKGSAVGLPGNLGDRFSEGLDYIGRGGDGACHSEFCRHCSSVCIGEAVMTEGIFSLFY